MKSSTANTIATMQIDPLTTARERVVSACKEEKQAETAYSRRFRAGVSYESRHQIECRYFDAKTRREAAVDDLLALEAQQGKEGR